MNVRIPKNENTHVEGSKDIARIMRKIRLRQNKLRRKKEYFWTIGLSSKNDIEYIELLTIGVLNQNSIDPVEVFNFAVAKKCKRIILCHNHPSGDTTPSLQDISVTQRIKKGADVPNIELLDHLIICDSKEFTSFDAMELI